MGGQAITTEVYYRQPPTILYVKSKGKLDARLQLTILNSPTSLTERLTACS